MKIKNKNKYLPLVQYITKMLWEIRNNDRTRHIEIFDKADRSILSQQGQYDCNFNKKVLCSQILQVQTNRSQKIVNTIVIPQNWGANDDSIDNVRSK